MTEKRKVCVLLTDRANYGRLFPVMQAVKEHPKLELQVLCTGTMLLSRFGNVQNKVEEDGFIITSRVFMELEGSLPITMAKSVGYGIIEFSSELMRLQTQILLVIGDRYEALAAVIAAAFQNITIAHIQGGEVSGSIDESTRHAITKYSHFHFPSTDRSAQYLIKMGENPKTVFNFGCPAGDYILKLDDNLPDDVFNSTGVGANINPNQPFLLVMFHPVTTEFQNIEEQIKVFFDVVCKFDIPIVWLWPNIDAGSEIINKTLRRYRENMKDHKIRYIKTFTPETFQKVLKKCACAVGNSSSFVRDSTFSGTPVVLVGDRQKGREIGENCQVTSFDAKSIRGKIEYQLKHGRYKPSFLYGNGNTSTRIVETIASVELYTQKNLHYINE